MSAGRSTSTVRTVLFDLDGTLSNSEPGILMSLRRAFADVGVAPITPAQERALLGPPFYDSLPPLVGAGRLAEVIEAYRRHYSAGGMYDTVLYDGVGELLAWLRERGCVLAVATSKPEPYAVPIVEHLGLSDEFAVICGDTHDGARASKELVVAEALRRLGRPDPRAVVMVGDRSHDVVGAHRNGLRCFGAGWGYGGDGELAAAGAITIAASPADLRVALAALLEGDEAAQSSDAR